MRYAFIKAESALHTVRTLCRMMQVHPSGYYAWLRAPETARAGEDRRLLGHIKQSWLESGSVYGYRKVHRDLRELGLACGKHRVARPMRAAGLVAQRGYRGRRPGARSGAAPSVIAPNRLAQQFAVTAPNRVWVTDITYLRTLEGWLYLSVVLDLFSRQVIGWSMGPRVDRQLASSALLMAVWRRQPTGEVLVHSDQGCQFTSQDWQDFLAEHGLVSSMSRRGNCHDNAVAESFFQLLKRERIRQKTYETRQAARSDVFDYIEMFYNSKRRHGSSGAMSPVEFEKAYVNQLVSV